MAWPAQLGAAQQTAIAKPEKSVLVSSVTVWGIAIKRAHGRLKFPLEELDDVARRMGFDFLPLQPAHAVLAGGLPRYLADPFDRMLVAQASVEGLTLVTRDSKLGQYDVRILRPAG